LSINKFLDSSEIYEPDAKKILTVAICRLALAVVPDIQTKIYEHIVAEELSATVCEKLTGPDLITDDGKTMEIKMSRVIQKTKKCNFAWPIPEGSTIDERRQRLIASAKVKGDARCDLVDGRAKLIKTYSLKADFLAAFFSRIPIEQKSQKINLGSTFCHKCSTCSRMDKFQSLSDKFPKLEEKDWEKALMREKTHEC
jgi:hypothetical protein